MYWHWIDYLKRAAALNGRQPCFLNLDETSIPQATMKATGYFQVPGQKQIRPRRRLEASLRKGMATHVAIIADDTSVQAALPQIFMVNRRLFKKKDIVDLPVPRVQIQRGFSAWNSHEKMVDILYEIGDVMLKFPQKQPILLLDCAPCHTQWEVIAAANANGIWLLYIPARMTSILQPLDVCAFGSYKSQLSRAFLSQEVDAGLPRSRWSLVLARLVKEYWRGNKWRAAFERVGVHELRRADSMTRQLRKLKPTRIVTDDPPTEEDLLRILPRGHRSLWASVFLLPANLAGIELPELA